MADTRQPAEEQRATIVVVEDDQEILDLELFLLSSEGFKAVGVTDGDHAAPTAAAEGADLMVLDLMLPGKDGNAVLQELQEDPATAGIPVIVVSAYTDSLQRTPQVRQIIAKPFDVAELLDGIERELGPRGPR